MDGGAFQAHRSGWNIEDFDNNWDLTCVKEFHSDDGYGNVLEKPYGIIWAIKDIKWDNEFKEISFLELYLKKIVPTVIKKIVKKWYGGKRR